MIGVSTLLLATGRAVSVSQEPDGFTIHNGLTLAEIHEVRDLLGLPSLRDAFAGCTGTAGLAVKMLMAGGMVVGGALTIRGSGPRTLFRVAPADGADEEEK